MKVAFDPGEWHGEQFSIRNFVYALQWWVFAVFAIWFWFRYIRDQRDEELAIASEEGAIARAQMAASKTGGVEPDTRDAESASTISLDAPAADRRKQLFGESHPRESKTNDQQINPEEQGE